eukprot:gnl/TRDRNA2_/TRDRNA2_187071_c0_seq1.p1 gnl/TRDRNA2_/TRDRNA2_187071_c0~~gnl/TRDRNA2_/TRDRNA2_187071_c0_seq1.p1  ORF type:complete len:283 (-),score=27.42 gnl/TRDRNA2_/TRDRNA2_187071_c0_seq1:75-923(-)
MVTAIRIFWLAVVVACIRHASAGRIESARQNAAQLRTDFSMKLLKADPKAALPWPSQLPVPDGITNVKINIGPNLSPIEGDAKTLVVLVDPLPSVVNYLKSKYNSSNVLIYRAAIADYVGTASFHEYNSDGLSSSLSTPTVDTPEMKAGAAGQSIETPVHTLKQLLDAIPANLPITFLKTDMQGYDQTAIKSAEDSLQRVETIMSETYQDGKPSYKGTKNELERDWKPLMQKQNMTLYHCDDGYVREPEIHEMDCHWYRTGYGPSLFSRAAQTVTSWFQSWA